MKREDLKSIKELPVKELRAQLKDLEDHLFKIKFSHSVTPLKNPLEIRSLRRQRARLLTWIRNKEVIIKK